MGRALRPRVIGCRARAPWYRERGPSRGRQIALTFDGGPTNFTPAIVHILHRFHVHSTFFIRGGFVSGRERLLREERRYGGELANHSFTHPHFPDHAELVRTSVLIHHVSGFWPCLFRAPYGDVNGSLLDSARRLGMVTVQWDIDTLDGFDAATSAQTIFGRVARLAQPGSIVLMHDGEGYHPPTIQALPRVIRMLRHRGYRLVTVSHLLGLAPRVLHGRGS